MRRRYSAFSAVRATAALACVAAALSLSAACASRPTRDDIAAEYYNLAGAYFELENWDAASRYYRRALAYEPGGRRARFNLARVEIERGAYSEARELLTALQNEDPDNHLISQLIGYAYYRAGELAEARELFERLRSEAPYDDRVIRNLAMVYAAEGTLESAAVLLADAAPTAGDPAAFYIQAVEFEYQREDRESARNYAGLLLREAEDPVAALRALGEIAYEYRDLDRAAEWYGALLDERPEDLDALFSRGALKLLIGEREAGETLLAEAFDLGFDDRERVRELLGDEDLENADELRAFLKEQGACFL